MQGTVCFPAQYLTSLAHTNPNLQMELQTIKEHPSLPSDGTTTYQGVSELVLNVVTCTEHTYKYCDPLVHAQLVVTSYHLLILKNINETVLLEICTI